MRSIPRLGNHRCLVEKNVPLALILPSRWQDGAESLGMECTSCLCFDLPRLLLYCLLLTQLAKLEREHLFDAPTKDHSLTVGEVLRKRLVSSFPSLDSTASLDLHNNIYYFLLKSSLVS